MPASLRLAAPLALALALAPLAAPAAPLVAADIPPVHSITARVMEGVGTPQAILPPGASPHGAALRPSAARLLSEADAVIWVGEALTPWLQGPIEALAGGAVLELAGAEGVILLPLREGGPFEAHDHDHGHDHDHDHDHDHGHDHGHIDAHLWLDPRNAAAMAAAVAGLLAEIDPANAATYRANAEAFAAEVTGLEAELAARLAPVAGRPYIVFHDAYQYFEHRFDMPAAGSVALSDAEQPSAARVAAIRDRIRGLDAACVFAEPQFEPRLVATLTEDTDARSGVLDPLGATLDPGPGLYPDLLTGLAEALAGCLGQ